MTKKTALQGERETSGGKTSLGWWGRGEFPWDGDVQGGSYPWSLSLSSFLPSGPPCMCPSPGWDKTSLEKLRAGFRAEPRSGSDPREHPNVLMTIRTRTGFVLALRKPFLTPSIPPWKGRSGIGRGCPGSGGIPSWEVSKSLWMWHWGTWSVLSGGLMLDSMISRGFPNPHDSKVP